MNPFAEIIEAAKVPRDVSVCSRLQLRTEVEYCASDDGLTPPAPFQGRQGSSALRNGTHETSHSDVEDEVYALLFRLKQIVGDIDTAPIIDKLNKLNTSTNVKPDAEKKIVPNTSLKLLDLKGNSKGKTAHFALTSPAVMNSRAEDNMWDSAITDNDESGDSTARSSNYSRYSLGSNRFSTRARQLSLGTLNYVGGNKLLRSYTRQSLLSPDPYACMSPAKPMAVSASIKEDTSRIRMDSLAPPLEEPKRGPPNFAEFCIVGVQSDLVSGRKALETTSLQPTEALSMYPVDAEHEAIVGNLHEYCFPFGAELKYVTRRELDLLAVTPAGAKHINPLRRGAGKATYGLSYQIMQFTDAVGTVYYAVCVISSEPVEVVTPDLQRNMNALQNAIAASNTIKRYLAFFVHRRKQHLNDALNAKWMENIKKARVKSTTSNASYSTSAESSGGKSNKSLFKALKKAMGVSFKPAKGEPSEKSGTWFGPAGGLIGTGRSVSTDKVSDPSSTTSPADTVDRKRFGMGHHSQTTSPVLNRQRSKSFTSPPRKDGLGYSHDDADVASSLDTTISLGAAEVGVDGSPCRSRSFQRKLDQSSRKVAVLTQRAYCIISDKPLHAIFFQVLEAIALKERERALNRWGCMTGSNGSVPGSPKSRGSPLPGRGLLREASLGGSNSLGTHLARQAAFLANLQYVDLSTQKHWAEGKRPVAFGKTSAKTVELAGHEYMSTLHVPARVLSLKEWTVALLVSILPAELIVKIHSLLLQELSLLVYGTDAATVTAVATAFSQLLQPFSWEGIFVPLLPLAAYEALDAPVPFIVGVVGSSRPVVQISSSAGLLCVDDFVHHLDLYVPSCFDEVTLRHTLAAREGHLHDISGRSTAVPVELDHSLKFYEAPCPEENQQGASQLLDPLQCSQLKELYQFVAYHAVKIKASLRALQHQQSVVPYNATTSIKAVMYDLSAEALRSLDRILERVAAYNRSLCGEVLTQPGGWRQFGVLNSRSNQFEFLPDLFLAPLKANLRLQESVINTQLFVSFMDEQSEEYEKLTPQRVFISEWLYFRLQQRKKSRRHSARVHLYGGN